MSFSQISDLFVFFWDLFASTSRLHTLEYDKITYASQPPNSFPRLIFAVG